LNRGQFRDFDALNGTPFPNNVLAKSRLHPGALSVLNLFVFKAQFTQSDDMDAIT
jgi:hypothetical protein